MPTYISAEDFGENYRELVSRINKFCGATGILNMSGLAKFLGSDPQGLMSIEDNRFRIRTAGLTILTLKYCFVLGEL